MAAALTSLPSIAGDTLLEVLHSNETTAVYRAVPLAQKQTAIIKLLHQTIPGTQTLINFHNQYSITQALSIPGLVHPLSLLSWESGHALILEDFGSISLDQWLKNHTLTITQRPTLLCSR